MIIFTVIITIKDSTKNDNNSNNSYNNSNNSNNNIYSYKTNNK